MNANTGYRGWSMSNRAVEAYENGEKPFSKWTKKAIIARVAEIYGQDLANVISAWSLESLKRIFLTYSSWHHTSKFFNKTDFFSVNEELSVSPADLWAEYEKAPAMTASDKQAEIEKCYNLYNASKNEQNSLLWEKHFSQVREEKKENEQNSFYEIRDYEFHKKNEFLLKLAKKADSLLLGKTSCKAGELRKDLTSNGKTCIYLNKKILIQINEHGKTRVFPENL